MKRTPLRARSKKKTAGDAEYAASRKIVARRADGRCEIRSEACTGRHEHTHHIRRRSQGGTHDPANLAATCAACHHLIHDVSPAWGYEHGWLVRQ